jgi:predicted acyltransferase
MDAPWFGFVLSVFASWRLTHLLAREDGPWDLLARLRARLGSGVLGRLMDCFYCVSLWVAAPFGLLVGRTAQECALAWLALSGAACLLERRVRAPLMIQHLPTEGEHDELLRREADGTADGTAEQYTVGFER